MKHTVFFRTLLFFLVLAAALSACSRRPSYPEAPLAGPEVQIPLSGLRERSPVFYSFSHGGKRMSFFVVMVNGEAEAYLDACRTCAPYKKGFFVQDGELACRACGERYSLDNLKGVGGCYPIPLPLEQRGESLYVSADDLIGRMKYF